MGGVLNELSNVRGEPAALNHEAALLAEGLVEDEWPREDIDLGPLPDLPDRGARRRRRERLWAERGIAGPHQVPPPWLERN